MRKINKLMNRLSILTVLFFVIGCTDNDVEPLYDQSINERTEALKGEYFNILTAPENGWIGYYSPNESFGAYTMLMNFDVDSNVDIKSDYELGDQDNEITFRIDKTLKIELVLESFSVFSQIFSLNDNNNGGEFVFNILSATPEEIILESKLDFGDDVTILTLRRANTSDFDLQPIYESVEDIAGDGTESVFRNILLNDVIIASFDFNPLTRLATVSYVDNDGVVIFVNAPIAILPTGFNFIKPIDVNGTILTSFTFDETKNEYVNEADGLRILYDNIPGVPLMPYDLGETANNARFNYLEPEKSSVAFNNFFNDFNNDFSAATGGATIARVYIRSLSDDIPYLHIYIGNSTFWYDLNMDVEDGIVKFSLTGETNASAGLTSLLQPLIDVFVGAPSGYYLNRTGGLLHFSNGTFSMINVDDTSMEINYYDF